MSVNRVPAAGKTSEHKLWGAGLWTYGSGVLAELRARKRPAAGAAGLTFEARSPFDGEPRGITCGDASGGDAASACASSCACASSAARPPVRRPGPSPPFHRPAPCRRAARRPGSPNCCTVRCPERRQSRRAASARPRPREVSSSSIPDIDRCGRGVARRWTGNAVSENKRLRRDMVPPDERACGSGDCRKR